MREGTQCQRRIRFGNGIPNPQESALTSGENDPDGFVWRAGEWGALSSHPDRSQSVMGSVRNNLQVHVLGLERVHSRRRQERLRSRG